MSPDIPLQSTSAFKQHLKSKKKKEKSEKYASDNIVTRQEANI